MANITKCPDCGVVIALRFVIHDCKPERLAARYKRKLIRGQIEECDVCQDRKAIAVPGDSYACRKHQKMLDAV